MKKIILNWKLCLVALGVVAVCACSENEDLAQVANKQNYQEGTRTANWYTKEVTLEEIGTLEAELAEVMNGEPLDTLEKLVVSGPMGAADFNYFRNNLAGIKSLDLKNVSIKASDDYYYHIWGKLKNDTVCHSMFSSLSHLREIQLPLTTLYIDSYAFSWCDSLESIVIPENVTILNQNTFEYCRSLASVTLSSNLEGIHREAFYDCNSLESIDIPDKVKFIGYQAFQSCDLLSSVDFSPSSELDSIAGWAFCQTKLKTITIPDKVRKIEHYAFYDCDFLSSVTLSSNLENLGNCMLQECDSLQSIVIPDKVKFIGNSAFYYCHLLSSVEFSSTSELDSIAFDAFMHTNIKSIVIPEKVKYIGHHAFAYCDSLSSVVLPDEIKSIEEHTFYDCKSLKSIKLPSKLETIGKYAITATLIENLDLPSTLTTISSYAFEHNGYITKIVIPEGVETIGDGAFNCNGSLVELTIPKSVTSISTGFANECSQLQALYWYASIDVPYNYRGWNSNSCFVYVETDQEITVDGSWNYFILNGVAQFPVTIQASTNNEFKILKGFTAPEVIYTRYFGDTTVPGGSSGWQTIVLPFTPDTISHASKGLIAPFGSDVEGAKPFWLRELTADGFVDVDSIAPDKAYIIAMPNNSAYLDEYRLSGNITFKAKNVTLTKTPDELEPSYGPDFDFYPTYNYVKKALRIYALQSIHGYYDNMWYNKNFFTRSSSDIYPFNAYVTAKGGGRSSRTEFDLNTRSSATRGVPYKPNTSGIPQIGDM